MYHILFDIFFKIAKVIFKHFDLFTVSSNCIGAFKKTGMPLDDICLFKILHFI